MAKVTGRIVAYRHNHNDGVSSTTLFFADGNELNVDGELHFPQAVTMEVRYEKTDDPEPHTLKGLKVVAG